MPVLGTSTVTIQYTGTATAPDNFTIRIIDYNSTQRIYNNTDVTKVSRATLISGYNVTGITAGDTTVRATSSGSCTTFAEVDVTDAGMQYYTPSGNVTALYDPTIASLDTGGGSNLHVATISTFPFINDTDWSVSFVSTTGYGGGNVSPFSGFSVTEPTPGTFHVTGTANALSIDGTTNTSVFRVTYLPNGNYADFNFKWVTGV